MAVTQRHHSTGNGDACPVDPEGHGRMVVIRGTSAQYCPHQSHDKDGTPALYEGDGKTPLRRKR